ncbi:hypothetical protein INT48_006844 [Thamnidium elegans]|uniref:Uncharacterized protein n=1 Tax=Thamnidium elegans TaxID=101142 RepID=A0A8H7SQF3_9FUNG|nr:hypothetical protein INT48_006844 [Thamnidium elegans]
MKHIRISRAKFENIAYLTLNVINISTYLMVFAASIVKANQGTLADIIQAIYCTMISFLLVLHEFTSPAWSQMYFGFLSIHRGKSLLMLFLGCLVMCEIAFNIIVAIITFTIGFGYFILSLIPVLPPPNAFLVHWRNHKDFWAEGLDLAVPAVATPMMIPHPSAWHPNTGSLQPMHSKFQNSVLDNNKVVIY